MTGQGDRYCHGDSGGGGDQGEFSAGRVCGDVITDMIDRSMIAGIHAQPTVTRDKALYEMMCQLFLE